MKKSVIALLILFILLSCKGKNKKETTTEHSKEAPQQSTRPAQIEKPQFAQLTAGNLDKFIAWASASGVDEKQRVREEISKMSKDTSISKLLFQRFDSASLSDITYSLVVLSIIGELKQPTNLGKFETITWQRIPQRRQDFHGGLDSADAIEMIASKAVECMAWLGTPESDNSVLRVIREHSSQAIRSAAIDGYLFSKNDSEEARKYLLRIVRKEDIPFIYRVRFNDVKGDKSFNDAIEKFYKQFPEAVAAAPGNPTEKVNQDTIPAEKPIDPPKRRSN